MNQRNIIVKSKAFTAEGALSRRPIVFTPSSRKIRRILEGKANIKPHSKY